MNGRLVMTLCLLCSFAWLRADDPKPQGKKPDAPKSAETKPQKQDGPPEFDIAFWDGSNVVVTVEVKDLPIKTKYGSTTLPWADVRRIEFSQAPVAGKTQSISIDAKDLTLKGSLAFDDIAVKTKQFGETKLKFAMVKTLRRVNIVGGISEVSVSAEKYAKQGWSAWYDSGLTVNTDQELEIIATGEIDQWAQTPGRYKSTPKGTGSIVQPPPGQEHLLTMGMDGGPPGMPPPFGQQRTRISSGMLIGKIGESGKLFMIGDKFKAKPPASGRLYLIIAPSNWGNDSTGEYKVTVKLPE